jgi:hypothetical protein
MRHQFFFLLGPGGGVHGGLVGPTSATDEGSINDFKPTNVVDPDDLHVSFFETRRALHDVSSL